MADSCVHSLPHSQSSTTTKQFGASANGTAIDASDDVSKASSELAVVPKIGRVAEPVAAGITADESLKADLKVHK